MPSSARPGWLETAVAVFVWSKVQMPVTVVKGVTTAPFSIAIFRLIVGPKENVPVSVVTDGTGVNKLST